MNNCCKITQIELLTDVIRKMKNYSEIDNIEYHINSLEHALNIFNGLRNEDIDK